MSATLAQVKRLRRMVNESTSATYSDGDIQGYIQAYPVMDGRGEAPWVESETTPGTLEENDDWSPTYDLHAAAAAIWEEKAALLTGNYDFKAGDQSFNRSQAYEAAMKQARYHQSRRRAGTMTLRPEPRVEDSEVILSNAE